MQNDIFSIRVKTLRLDSKLSQKSLGALIGLSMQAINDIENARSKTTLDRAALLADYFDVSIDYLVGRTDNPKVNK